MSVFMSDPVYDEVEEAVRKMYPNSCILWIDKVENASLREAYEKQKEDIIEKRGSVKEMRLFHGTSEEAVHSIAQNGFDPERNRVCAYGKGTYFAVSASYSKDYAKAKTDEVSFMMLCDVLVGTCCRGSSAKVINTVAFDNAVNNLHNPTIYVTPYRYGAFPTYVIAFHKNAK